MEQTVFVAEPTRLLIAAAVGITVLLLLIIKFKLHPVISMMIAAIIIGVGAGMPLTMISSTVEKVLENITGNSIVSRTWLYVWRNPGSKWWCTENSTDTYR